MILKHSLLLVCLFTGLIAKAEIPEKTIQTAINAIQAKGGTDKTMIEAGVRQVAHLWQPQDGTDAEFQEFCVNNFITTPAEKEQVFQKVSHYLKHSGDISTRFPSNCN